MNALTWVMLGFSVLGALDRILGNRFGLGKEWEKGFHLMGVMMLSMTGMIIIAPLLGDVLSPVLEALYSACGFDPSLLPSLLLANDMGGAPLALDVGRDAALARYNGLVVTSMMGCTVSFTIPYALSAAPEEKHKSILLGILCGVVTVPVGCLAAGLFCGIPLGSLLWNAVPMLVFSGLCAAGLLLFPKQSVAVFGALGTLLKILITVGLLLGIIRFLTGKELIAGLDTLENGTLVCMNAAAVMSGAFPLLYTLSKLLTRPMRWLGGKLGINEASAFALFGSLATSATTFRETERMDDKGVVLNSAFAVSAAFTFAGHLAFTMAYDASMVVPMIVGKLISGVTALVLAIMICKKGSSL